MAQTQKTINPNLEEVILCQCENPEHQLIFKTVGGCEEVFVTFHLRKFPFWERVKNGMKYIFGHTSVYGDFDELILRAQDAEKIERVAQFLKKSV